MKRIYTRAEKNFDISAELLNEYHQKIGAEVKQKYLIHTKHPAGHPTWIPALPESGYPPPGGQYVSLMEWKNNKEDMARRHAEETHAKLDAYPHLRQYTSGPTVVIVDDPNT